MTFVTRHIGLDLSLTSTGVCRLEAGLEPQTVAIKSKPNGQSLRARRDRILSITEQIRDFAIGDLNMMAPLPDQADNEFRAIRWYVEAPTYATHTGAQHDRSGLWWDVVGMAMAYGEVTEVSPTNLKKFATGKGNGEKTFMAVAAAREFPGIPGVELENNDRVDALWLAVLSEYVLDADAGRVHRTGYRDSAASAVPRG